MIEVTANGDEQVNFSSSGILIPGKEDDNLCLKAYRLLSQDHQLPGMKIHLHKVIPTGAGLGGGSSDGIHLIKLLNEKFELGISWGEMHDYARKLGSDCSFFVSGKTCFATGRGDEQESIRLDLSGKFLYLVYPGIHISTAEAYSLVNCKQPEYDLERTVLDLKPGEWKEILHNDFEISICNKYPLIGEIKEKLYSLGAVYASMSGSGSAVYGIFDHVPEKETSFRTHFTWLGKM